MQTCDKRHPKSWLQERFPAFVFEQGFEEKDKLWTVDEQEHPLHQTYRLHKAMERVFAEHKEATCSFFPKFLPNHLHLR